MIDCSTEIVQNPRIRAGKPVLAGTRVGVHDVVRYASLYGGNLERVRAEALPHLSVEQLQAALAWYDVHRELIDEILDTAQRDYDAGLAGPADAALGAVDCES